MLKGNLKAMNLSENSVWYSIMSRRLWVLMWRESTCARADFQSLGLHPWSALFSLSIDGTKQCRIASAFSAEALRKCRQIPSVLPSFLPHTHLWHFAMLSRDAENANRRECQDYRCFRGALTFLLPTQSDWGVGQAFLDLRFNSITKYLLLGSSL